MTPPARRRALRGQAGAVASSPPATGVSGPARPPPMPGASGRAAGSQVQVQVLVVEPARGQRQAIVGRLRAAGLTVAEAADPTDALALAARLRPTVVVVEPRLPRRAGVGPVGFIRELCQVYGAQVVAYTRARSTVTDRQLLAAGVYQIVAKRRVAELVGEVLDVC